MSEEPSTPGTYQSLPNEETQAAAATTSLSSTPSLPTPPSSTPSTPDQASLFIEAYDCAKNNHNWNKVSSAISNHPEWLTRVPPGLFK